MAEQEKPTTLPSNNKGRPSILTDEMVMKAKSYLVPSYDLPTIEGLALELDISRDTLYDWEKKNEDFSYILSKLRLMQANKLIQKGVKGEYNAAIVKMMLTKHGYVEKSEQDLTTNGKDLAMPILVKFVGDDDSDDRNT